MSKPQLASHLLWQLLSPKTLVAFPNQSKQTRRSKKLQVALKKSKERNSAKKNEKKHEKESIHQPSSTNNDSSSSVFLIGVDSMNQCQREVVHCKVFILPFMQLRCKTLSRSHKNVGDDRRLLHLGKGRHAAMISARKHEEYRIQSRMETL